MKRLTPPVPDSKRLQPAQVAVVIGLLLLTPSIGHASENSKLYGSIAAEHYVTGQFSASKHAEFVTLETLNIPTIGYEKLLRREAAQALKQMIAAFRSENPDINIRVASAHRNFHQQRSIWEAKWTGRRKVEGLRLNEAFPEPRARAIKILDYSAMPGASRHHWGTEVDFNKLHNSYYESGTGLIIYNWLRKNAAAYGFCQPYSAGRTLGHREEKWHWSYRPLAAQFQRKWERLFAEDTDRFLRSATFAGNQAAAPLAPAYQKSINPACTETIRKDSSENNQERLFR